ncbi:helix-turn-helix domain-containing protein [Rhodocytophaga rosea]|uniref:Helix-turn-helix domain-containing protein n=1 Tax=Rhodocytophaga rosea TaxID=2704465 RepID=A0A6C0GI49_9BACT|nr:helix-turn-helix domain-containing protein [Rhodocytophaga rosea]QHT67400.1 helix-turn-helix domain-containing protein [Rhodocytophaga rosea]
MSKLPKRDHKENDPKDEFSSEHEKNSKGLWIPDSVLFNDDLNTQEKIIISVVYNFNKDKKKCFATNAYFSERIGIHENGISRLIKSLVERKYLSSTMITSYKGTNRVLTLLDSEVVIKKKSSSKSYNLKEHNLNKKEASKHKLALNSVNASIEGSTNISESGITKSSERRLTGFSEEIALELVNNNKGIKKGYLKREIDIKRNTKKKRSK